MKQIINFNGTPIEPEFYKLATLLLDIMGEGEFTDVEDFKMSEDVILKTAIALKDGFNEERFSKDENGAMYYPGMTEDYGGLFEIEFNKHATI